MISLNEDQLSYLKGVLAGLPGRARAEDEVMCASIENALYGRDSPRITMSNDDVRAEIKSDPATKEAVFQKLLAFFNEHECWSGESYYQMDGPQIASMELMGDILDMLDAKVTYGEE